MRLFLIRNLLPAVAAWLVVLPVALHFGARPIYAAVAASATNAILWHLVRSCPGRSGSA